ncbi:glycoside hydrolase family 13 protein [Marinoscillum furvescens]|uniref:Glycosidase n=1 Tax=Marinoscillum furvescens DSM 4134 TaxID=1122208 RepID=A0A3D9L8Q8_MARFU|nr:glycoside hydrolase family 13 protein [Marinoscillum furvescens]REE01666.1 glycosidase [Marinoscillum furvescens DSM 4134]
MKKYLFIACAVLVTMITTAQAQNKNIERVEPPHWWVGMENSKLQLLIKGDNIGGTTSINVKPEGLSIVKIHSVENTDYLFVDVELSKAEAAEYQLTLKQNGKKVGSCTYELKKRTTSRDVIDNSDVLYLITPDRFVNGNPENDSVDPLRDKLNREHYNGRHGGDLQGILSKLDYMEDLGVTTLWLNPVLENAMPEVSYHGYAITDYYQVDPRYGSNELYKKLSDELSKRNMKLVMDMVFNHCGSEHWWIKEPPMEDWVHFGTNYTNTNHAMASIPDPHGADADRELMEKGWFVSVMPDLNHDIPFLEEYLIQNSIWWIEYAGLEGIRMDTYPYNKAETMQRWAERVLAEYPDFYLVGETWIGDELQEAYWAPQPGADYNSKLTSITDFPLCYGLHNTFKPEGDIRAVYDVLSKDYAYHDPMANKIFADNHDMDRYYYTIGENLDKFKNAMTVLLTTRGIPQIYYGTEMLMRKYGEHGDLREDFPGGWTGDERNAFTAEGRTEEENEAFDHLRILLNWRQTSEAVASGTLKHFVPHDNVYVYSRESASQKIVVFVNNSNEPRSVSLDRFREIIKPNVTATNALNGEQMTIGTSLSMEPNSSLILDIPIEMDAN